MLNRTPRSVRLGRLPDRIPQAVKVEIEDLTFANVPPSDETARWLLKIDAGVFDEPMAVGLVRERNAVVGETGRAFRGGLPRQCTKRCTGGSARAGAAVRRT